MTSFTNLPEESTEDEEEFLEQEEPLEEEEGFLEDEESLQDECLEEEEELLEEEEPLEEEQPLEEEEPLEEEAPKRLLKVASGSRPRAVAGAIAGLIREGGLPEVQAIGPHAVNQAIKAVAIARSYLEEEGVDIICVPEFIEVIIDDQERTAIRLTVQPR